MENNKSNKYKEGEVVYQKTNPTEKLVIRRYLNRVYYCTSQNDPKFKELALFEREIDTDPYVENPEY